MSNRCDCGTRVACDGDVCSECYEKNPKHRMAELMNDISILRDRILTLESLMIARKARRDDEA